MQWVGLATAVGRAIHVPALIREVVYCLLKERADILDMDVLDILYSGSHPTYRGGLVKKYFAAWWETERRPVAGEVLGERNIRTALEFHLDQVRKEGFVAERGKARAARPLVDT